jgi:uncharacterized protein (DUF983 family)
MFAKTGVIGAGAYVPGETHVAAALPIFSGVMARTRDRSRCPRCGERVSPFAAGCAVCGADLDVHRWDSGPRASTRLGSWLNAFTFGGMSPFMKWLLTGFAVVFLAGPVLALFGIYW